jgi:hypothetical protein
LIIAAAIGSGVGHLPHAWLQAKGLVPVCEEIARGAAAWLGCAEKMARLVEVLPAASADKTKDMLVYWSKWTPPVAAAEAAAAAPAQTVASTEMLLQFAAVSRKVRSVPTEESMEAARAADLQMADASAADAIAAGGSMLEDPMAPPPAPAPQPPPPPPLAPPPAPPPGPPPPLPSH